VLQRAGPPRAACAGSGARHAVMAPPYPRCVTDTLAVADTRWLDTHEQRVWRTWLSAVRAVSEAVESDLQRDADMPHTYYEVLVRLSESPGRGLRMSALAHAAGSSRSRLSHAVDRLAERGWVQRVTCDTDGRGQVAVLTDAGYEALVEAAPNHVESVRRALFDRLTPEQVSALGEIGAALADGVG
jgi:DNA-binding MarR family transcriptional regulator